MEKFIIEAHEGITPMEAMYYAMKVAQRGRVSVCCGEKQHCYVTVFPNNVHVSVTRNRSGSERFRVHKP